MPTASTARPRLAPDCQVSCKPGEKITLTTPQRPLPLLGPSLQIVERCDGKRTVAEIIMELQNLYVKAKPEKVEQDVRNYLEMLHQIGAVIFE